MPSARRPVLFVAALLAGVLMGCGTSGSNPTLFPEVRFEVSPATQGTATFMVASLTSAGIKYELPPDAVFTATAPFSFLLENAPPPYSATIVRAPGSSDIVVRAFRAPSETFSAEDATAGDKDTAMVVIEAPGGPPPSVTPVVQSPAVRLDVCAPSLGVTGCQATGEDPGIAGIPFTGSFGDPFLTHLLSGKTPSIYFLQGARDSVSGVVRSTQRLNLQIQLFIDNVGRESASGTSDLVVRQDL